MLDKRSEPEFDRRSPVQAGRSPAPYFIGAVAAAMLFWTAQQYWLSESVPSGSRHESPLKPQPASLAAGQSRADVRTVFTADDYPASALKKGEQGTVQAQLTIGSNGRVSACKVIRSSGYATLDDATCSILERRARFTPARDATGKPTEDTVVTPPIRWRLQG